MLSGFIVSAAFSLSLKGFQSIPAFQVTAPYRLDSVTVISTKRTGFPCAIWQEERWKSSDPSWK
jgi:hypothetical protein